MIEKELEEERLRKELENKQQKLKKYKSIW